MNHKSEISNIGELEPPIVEKQSDDLVPAQTPPVSPKPEDYPQLKRDDQMQRPSLEPSADIIYDGGIGIQNVDDDDVEYKVIFDEKSDHDGNDVEIDVRGVKYKIPFAIECHLCNEMMNLCLRRTRYRGQNRDYPAYRCNRKGCQTFRSIRKVFHSCVTDNEDRMVYQPAPTPLKSQSSRRGDYSDDDNDEFVIQRVYLPKPDKRHLDPSIKPLSVTDRVRRANQERAVVFSEFADQLRRDIAANKRVRVRKQLTDEDEQQGTLFYISKELNPHEVIELQDAVIKTLISLRKIPPPMTMLDLPLFANCPFSKKNLEAGLESPKQREVFWSAVTNAPQPPLPPGFIRRKDDTLIYRDPKPYVVPEILQENSPRKQAEDMINYQQRKEEQDAKRMERRHTEKKIRTWASLKREFDLAETDDCPTSKLVRTAYDSLQSGSSDSSGRSDRREHQVTLQEIIEKMEGDSNGRITGKIRSSDRNSDQMLWINDKDSPSSSDSQDKKMTLSDIGDNFESDRRLKTMQEMMKTMPLRMPPLSPLLRPGQSGSNMFGDEPFGSGQYNLHSFNPYHHYSSSLNQYDHYQNIGATEVVHTEPPISPFTFIHPDSGVRLTDPSVYLTTFMPSPITKVPPLSFVDDVNRGMPEEFQSSSLPISHEVTICTQPSDDAVGEEDEELEDKSLVDKIIKFDPPTIEN